MKKLFLIVAAMFAAVSFSACSDDDDNGHVSDKPVLVKQCIITEEYGETDIVYFEYDSQNRISHISSAERTDGKEEFLFSYEENIFGDIIIGCDAVLLYQRRNRHYDR